MGIRVKRKVFRLGSGKARGITLPAAWLSYLGSDVDTVTIIGSDLLVIAPPGLEKKAESIVSRMEGREAIGNKDKSTEGGIS
jgi:hypothetical protein